MLQRGVSQRFSESNVETLHMSQMLVCDIQKTPGQLLGDHSSVCLKKKEKKERS